jgi:hypothetical protein
MNFATHRMGRLARDHPLQFCTVIHNRPTKPGITIYVCEIDPSVF